MIAWHECCKGPNRRRTAIRQVAEECDDMDIRRFDQRRFVTEARLMEFGRGLQESCTRAVNRAIEAQMGRTDHVQGHSIRHKAKGFDARSLECYHCHEIGHIAKYCPNRRASGQVIKGTEQEARPSDLSQERLGSATRSQPSK